VTGERKQVLPRDFLNVFLLILQLDEGSVGSSGVAFSAFQHKKTFWGKFDKIHRIIRDLQLSETHACNKLFQKAKLWSAYLYGLNNRPFGKGGFFTLKERCLSIFTMGHDARSPTVQKHMSRVAKSFKMQCDTPAEQERVFNKMLLMKSFNQKLGQPKVSNWFAWNSCAEVHIPEFAATKCIFEAVFYVLKKVF